MFPMGYYDYGFGLGYGMSQMVPPPAVVNHQADENVYVAHHESNDGATIALLSFAALGSLAGLLIARKANKTTKLVDAVTHDLRETAKKGADDILKSAKETAAEEAAKIKSDAKEYAGGVKSEVHEMRKTTAAEVKKAEGLRLEAEADVAELRGLIARTKESEAELSRLIAEARKPVTVPVTRPVAAPRTSGRVDTRTKDRFLEPDKVETIVVKGEDPKAVKAAKAAAKEALPKADTLLSEGHALCGASKFEEALPKFLESVKIYEDNLTYFGRLDDYHLEGYSLSLNNAGVCYKQGDKIDEAIKYFDKAIAVFPKKPNQHALFNLADCHRQLGNEGELVKCLKSLSDLDDVPAMIELAGIKEAQAQKFMRKTGATATDVAANSAKSSECYKEAAELYKKAAGKGNVDAKVKLAQLYEHGPKDLKNDVEAAKLYKEAMADCVQMVESGKGDALVIQQLKTINIALGGLKSYSNDPGVAKLFAEDKAFEALYLKSQGIAGNGGLKTDGILPDVDIPLKKGDTLPGVGHDSSAPTGQFVQVDKQGKPVKPVLTADPASVKIGLDVTTPSGAVVVPRDTLVEAKPAGAAFGEDAGNVPRTLVPTGDEEARIGKDTLVPTGDEGAKIGKDTIVPTGDEAASGAHQATDAGLPKPVMVDEVAEGAERASEEQAFRELAEDLGAHEQQAAAGAERASGDAATIVPRTLPVDHEALAARTLKAPASAEAVTPQASTHVGEAAGDAATIVPRTLPVDPGVASSERVAGDAAIPRPLGEVGNEAETIVPETVPVDHEALAASQTAHAAEAVVEFGEHTTAALNLIAGGDFDGGFTRLGQAILKREIGSRETLFNICKGVYVDGLYPGADKQKYLFAAINTIIKTSKTGVEGVKEQALELLEQMYKSKKLGQVQIPDEWQKAVQKAYAESKGITEGTTKA